MNRPRTSVGILVVVLGLALAACGGASEGTGKGVVRGVDREQGRVTLEHGEIPGMMKAMTMTFEVSPPELLEGVEEGEPVTFQLRYADGTYTVISIERR
jgi:Cu/Ag efflux protein CusF